MTERSIFEHHRATIERAVAKLAGDERTLAVLVGGSIAHGFAIPSSDVDIMIVVAEEEARRRVAAADAVYFDGESATYEGGYVDGKYISTDFIRTVAERGSEPARFAFKGAIVAHSRIDGLDELLAAAARYPIAEKAGKIAKFHAQLRGWQWFCHEAFRLDNAYLLSQAIPSLVLFAGRLVLAWDEVLYPYHKWFLRVLRDAEPKPDGLMEQIEAALARRDREAVDALFESVDGWRDWPGRVENWGNRFMLDTELAWKDRSAAVADL